MPGPRGPVPKAEDQRRRRYSANEGPRVEHAPAGSPFTGEIPDADPNWHPIAIEWFESLFQSGQSRFFEASDVAQARLVADMMSKLVKMAKPSAQLFASVLQGTSLLLATEGDRRRLRLELARGTQIDEDEESSVANLADYMTRVGG